MACACEQLIGKELSLAAGCITDLWIFRNLPPVAVQILSASAVRRIKPAGLPLFVQGDPVEGIFLIKAGCVKLSKSIADDCEIILGFRNAGDFLGGNPIDKHARYPMTAWCVTETLICGFTRARFEQTVLTHPEIGLQIVRNLSQRLPWSLHPEDHGEAHGLAEHIHEVLVELAYYRGARRSDGGIMPYIPSLEDLAFLMGVDRLSVETAMCRLVQAGKIRRDKQKLVPLLF